MARRLRLPLGFLAALLVFGVPYWRMPYAQSDPSALYPGLAVLAAIALMLAVVNEGRLRWLLVTMAACPAVAVVLRVAVETAADPTSHNLWPFEVVIALVAGAVAVLPALVAGVIARRSRRQTHG